MEGGGFCLGSSAAQLPKHTKVCRQLIELQTRLGTETSLIAEEVAHA
jgi:hypothetical protein